MSHQRTGPPRKQGRPTKAEDELLRRYAARGYMAGPIAKQMNRDVTFVRKRAKALGVMLAESAGNRSGAGNATTGGLPVVGDEREFLKARQLAEDLRAGAQPWFLLTREGWVEGYARHVAGQSPRWFAADKYGVGLTELGRLELLGVKEAA